MSPRELLATGLYMPDEAKTPYIRHLRNYYIKPQKRDKAELEVHPTYEKGTHGDGHRKIYWFWNEDESYQCSQVQRGTFP